MRHLESEYANNVLEGELNWHDKSNYSVNMKQTFPPKIRHQTSKPFCGVVVGASDL